MIDWYTIAKYLHVASAILWLGGALLMTIIGTLAARANDDAELIEAVRRVAWAAERIFVPSSVATLIFGILATILGGWWAQLWIILGLLGVAATIAIGVVVLTPRAKKVEADFKAGGPTPAVVAQCKEILTIAKFDMVLLYTIVADMVLKPQLGDWITYLIFVVVLGAAGYFFIYPMMNRTQPAAA